MGLVYLPTWMVDFCGFHVDKYTGLGKLRESVMGFRVTEPTLRVERCLCGQMD